MAVLLGLCDDEMRPEDESKIDVNRIGGTPVFRHGSASMPVCRYCGSGLVLVVQLSCPLDDSSYQRVLYLFACVQKACQNKSGSWRVYRYQYLDNRDYKPQPISSSSSLSRPDEVFKACDWCDDADDWGEESATDGDICQSTSEQNRESEDSLTDVLQQSLMNEKIESSGKVKVMDDVTTNESECIPEDVSVKVNDDLERILKFSNVQDGEWVPDERIAIVPFVCYYMSAVEEPLGAGDEVDDHVTSLLEEYQKREGVVRTDRPTSGGASEAYEKAAVAHGDDIFRKFVKRVQRYPQQCLRYSWSGQPVYIKKLSESISACSYCRQRRVFEMQLMPGMITYLRRSDCGQGTLDFGTVLVYCCENSCWTEEDSVREEQCIVQSDPDNELFK